MHPLRFLKSGIRAKVFMRKIGFKLRVMKLYHENHSTLSCYVFIVKTARRRGDKPRPAPMQGRRPTTGHGQGQPARGGHPLGQQPVWVAPVGTADCCQPAARRLQRGKL
ncbi:hypothetical protein B296_00009440 [Ensete ventricosum]|uniref:Uncharacterized protein n=1 Tax=Ensete ventricosum TaxID=4639 RepID=A0A426YZY8_ENSVE|nr:hypothetical protein B296_00009440 [Ensete ventricosum]